MTTQNRRSSLKDLVRCLNISLEIVKKTIRATTQLAVRAVDEPSLSRKFRTNDRMLRYIKLLCNTFMDTCISSKKVGPLVRSYTTCQVFTTEFGYFFAVPMEGKADT